jgi:site-specific DNA-methyltransferase (adenine-specific)
VYADKRANPAGRLPDDTWVLRPAPDGRWVLRPQDLPEGFQPADDTWYYARVAGTFKERQGFHGCQMPEQLLGRIIRVSSNPGDVVLDPFAGSGTTLAVAKKLGREWIGCELSEEYVRAASERLDSLQAGDPLDGPADPIASAPTTANGRRLDQAAKCDETTKPTTPAPAIQAPVVTKRNLRELVADAIVAAFFATHNGCSIDWLLADLERQSAFHEACRDAGLFGGPIDWNHELLRLRKSGRFPKRGKAKTAHLSDQDLDRCDFAAEIAWRLTDDKFRGPSLDEIFCDPAKAAFFDRAAKRFAPGCEPAQYRWAALRLRKASRDLVRDVKQYHFVFSTRDFGRFQSADRINLKRLAGEPGVYLLRGEEKAPLYVGRTLDLAERLASHAECPAIADFVAQVSVIAGDDLPGEDYQAAFKEDLVRRYQPRWNASLVGLQQAVVK